MTDRESIRFAIAVRHVPSQSFLGEHRPVSRTTKKKAREDAMLLWPYLLSRGMDVLILDLDAAHVVIGEEVFTPTEVDSLWYVDQKLGDFRGR